MEISLKNDGLMFFKFTQMATSRKGKQNLLGVKNRKHIFFFFQKTHSKRLRNVLEK